MLRRYMAQSSSRRRHGWSGSDCLTVEVLRSQQKLQQAPYLSKDLPSEDRYVFPTSVPKRWDGRLRARSFLNHSQYSSQQQPPENLLRKHIEKITSLSVIWTWTLFLVSDLLWFDLVEALYKGLNGVNHARFDLKNTVLRTPKCQKVFIDSISR